MKMGENRKLFFQAIKNRAEIFLIIGKGGNALRDVDKGLSYNPIKITEFYLLLLKAHILLRGMNKTEESEKLVDLILNKFKHRKYKTPYSKVKLLKGSILLYKGQYAAAINIFEEIVSFAKIEQDQGLQGSALNNIAIILYRMGQFDKATNVYKKALKKFIKKDFKKNIVAT